MHVNTWHPLRTLALQGARRLAEQQQAAAGGAPALDDREPWHSGLTPSEVSLASLAGCGEEGDTAHLHAQHQRRERQPPPLLPRQRQPAPAPGHDARSLSPLSRRAGVSTEAQRPLSASARLAAAGNAAKRHRVSGGVRHLPDVRSDLNPNAV
jgi:hypothetical protein